MTEFEMVLLTLLIPVYGIMFYIAGRTSLLELLLKLAEEKLRDINDSLKD